MPTFRALQRQALAAGVSEKDVNMAMDKHELMRLIDEANTRDSKTEPIRILSVDLLLCMS